MLPAHPGAAPWERLGNRHGEARDEGVAGKHGREDAQPMVALCVTHGKVVAAIRLTGHGLDLRGHDLRLELEDVSVRPPIQSRLRTLPPVVILNISRSWNACAPS